MNTTPPWSRIDTPRAAFALLSVALVVALAVAASTSSAAFGSYNPAWDGAADLRSIADEEGLSHQIVRDTTGYEDVPADGTVAVILAPDRPYAADDANRVRRFVEAGGTVVVADSFDGPANALLADLGADARLDGRLLADERHYYRAPTMPVAPDVADHPLVAGGEEVTLNYGTVVEPNGATPLINTSSYAYLLEHEEDELGPNDELATYAVATVEQRGDGQVVVVSDPSIFINVMLERPGNRDFVSQMFSDHDRALLDYSHAADLPPLTVAVMVLREIPALQVLLGAITVASVGAWARRPGAIARVRELIGRLDRNQPSASERVASARERVESTRIAPGSTRQKARTRGARSPRDAEGYDYVPGRDGKGR